MSGDARPGQWALVWVDRFDGELVLETSGDIFDAGDFLNACPKAEGYGLFMWRGRAKWVQSHDGSASARLDAWEIGINEGEPYEVLQLDGEWSRVSREDVARIAHRCDGDHPEPPCISPECWQREPPSPAIEEGTASTSQSPRAARPSVAILVGSGELDGLLVPWDDDDGGESAL